MARTPNRRLPPIAFEEQTVRVKVDLPEALNQDVEQYGRYYAKASGRKPRSITDVIVGVLKEYLGSDQGFAAWKRANPYLDSSESPFSIKTEPRASSADGT